MTIRKSNNSAHSFHALLENPHFRIPIQLQVAISCCLSFFASLRVKTLQTPTQVESASLTKQTQQAAHIRHIKLHTLSTSEWTFQRAVILFASLLLTLCSLLRVTAACYKDLVALLYTLLHSSCHAFKCSKPLLD